jgi:hypothetical protein
MGIDDDCGATKNAETRQQEYKWGGRKLAARVNGTRQLEQRTAGFALRVAAPLLVLGFAFLAWWISDRLVYIGPIDRATFGWLVVAPLVAAAPLSAAIGWRSIDMGAQWAAALATGVCIAAVASAMLWLAVAFPNCQFGAVRTPADLVVPSLIVGLIFGGGTGAACLAAAAIQRRKGWLAAALLGSGGALGVGFLSVLVIASFIMTGGCQRP